MKSGVRERVEREGELEAEIGMSSLWLCGYLRKLNLRLFEEREGGGCFAFWGRVQGWHLRQEEKAIEAIHQTHDLRNNIIDSLRHGLRNNFIDSLTHGLRNNFNNSGERERENKKNWNSDL